MSLSKVTYTDLLTVIPASNLNAIQDELIDKCITVDNKSFTSAQKATARANIEALSKVLVVNIASFSSLPQIVTNSAITSDMVVINSVLGTPSAQTNDWTITTSNGSLVITGNISGSTTATLYLAQSQ